MLACSADQALCEQMSKSFWLTNVVDLVWLSMRDHSKAVVLEWFWFCLVLWFLLRGVRFMLCLTLLLILLFFGPIVITLLGKLELTWGRERRAVLYASGAFVCLSCMHYFLSFFLPPLAADCDCGTPWTFHLTFFKLPHQYIGIAVTLLALTFLWSKPKSHGSLSFIPNTKINTIYMYVLFISFQLYRRLR